MRNLPRTSQPITPPSHHCAQRRSRCQPVVSTYVRERDLPRLIPLWPAEIADTTAEGRLRLIQRLKRALREERRRGIGGDWTYDLRRHAGLSLALKAETETMPLPLTTWAAAPFSRHIPG